MPFTLVDAIAAVGSMVTVDVISTICCHCGGCFGSAVDAVHGFLLVETADAIIAVEPGEDVVL